MNKVWTNKHLSEQVLEEYAFGRLNELETSVVEEHLLVCDLCQDALTQVETQIDTIRAVFATHSMAPHPGTFALWERTARSLKRSFQSHAKATAAGALVLAFIVGIWAWEVGVWGPSGHEAAPALVILASFRGGANISTARGPAGQPLDLTIDTADVSGLPQPAAYRVEVVSGAGKTSWSGPVTLAADKLLAHVPDGLKAGVYWVRLYGPNAELMREFGLRLE